MSNFLNKIPVSPITSFGNDSVPNGATFGTNFSILQTGGYMEVYLLSGLTYTIPPATTGIIEFSGNSIPIQFTKGSGSVFSPDVLTLNSDNISSGRRKLGMLTYVYETNKIYQFRIDNYNTLWNNATGATGPGGPTVVISDYGTTVKNNSSAGIAFISAWTSSTISGIGGYNDTNASWRVLQTGSSGGGTFTGGTVSGATIFTNGLTANTISATTYYNLSSNFQYEIHVSQVDGNDTTGNGTLLNPVKTIVHALTLVGSQRKTIIIHPGTYTENPNITVQYTVLTSFELLGGNTEISGTLSTSSGCTISGLKMTNLNISASTGTGNVNVLNCDISGTLTKSNTGDYTLIRFCDIGTTNITSSGGLVAIFGGNPNFITINNVFARVIVKNAVTVAPVLTAGNANFVDSILLSTGSTSNAITTSVGTIVTLANSQIIVPTFNNVARVSLSGLYSIFNCVYDKPNSTLVSPSGPTLTSGSTNSIDYFQYINADKFITQGGTSSKYVMGDGSLSNGFTGGTVTGDTIFTSGLTANTISATTYQNLPATPFLPLSGGTVTGATNFTNGLTANTISATTYQNLPATPFLPLSGGTVSGATNFTNGLTANTISATTFTSSTETIIGIIPTSATGSVSTGAGSNPVNVYVQGRYAYVVNYTSNTLQIFDVSNSSSPVSVGTVSTGSGSRPYYVYVQGRYAYVITTISNTLQIFDVSNPSLPVLVSTISTGVSSQPYGVYVQGRYVYVVNYTSNTLQIFDASNPSLPVLVSTISTGSASPTGIYVQGRYAYVTNYTSNSLQIYDVSNPSSPSLVGVVSTGQGAYTPYVQGRYAYVPNNDSPFSLQIFDVSNPLSPSFVGSGTTGSNPRSVYVQGRYAYVLTSGSNTLQILDVSNPSSPVLVGTVSTGSGAAGTGKVYVQGRYAYVVNFNSNSLQIFDVGGSYIQQLEAGGILTNTLESVGNATIGNNLAVVGGLNVSQSANILGNLSATNMRVVSGLTANTISATTISATTYQNLPATPFLPLSGGTVSGATNFTNSLSANTLNIITLGGGSPINNLGIDSLGNIVTGIIGGGSLFTGGTVTGPTNFLSGLSATTITSPSVKTYGLIVATSLGYQNLF